MKREYYIDGVQVTKHTFFKYLESDVFKYWQNEPRIWTSFEDYYGYVKQKIRSGSEYSYGHTFWSALIRSESEYSYGHTVWGKAINEYYKNYKNYKDNN